MTASPATALYSPALLGLAVRLADYPYSDELPLRGEAHSRICGSSLEMGLAIDDAGCIADIGVRVKACAVGQAAAAIFASHAKGQDARALTNVLAQLELWLEGTGSIPNWPQIEELEPALPHRGRHAAIGLPWRAALAALCNDSAPR